MDLLRLPLYANRTKNGGPTLNMNAMENYLLSQSLRTGYGIEHHLPIGKTPFPSQYTNDLIFIHTAVRACNHPFKNLGISEIFTDYDGWYQSMYRDILS